MARLMHFRPCIFLSVYVPFYFLCVDIMKGKCYRFQCWLSGFSAILFQVWALAQQLDELHISPFISIACLLMEMFLYIYTVRLKKKDSCFILKFNIKKDPSVKQSFLEQFLCYSSWKYINKLTIQCWTDMDCAPTFYTLI